MPAIMNSTLLPCPPSPAPHVSGNHTAQTADVYSTPPPSPNLSPKLEFKLGEDFLHWGHLKPVNANSPYNKWYLGRQKSRYSLGYARDMDLQVDLPGILAKHCTISWDGSDSDSSVQVISHFSADNDTDSFKKYYRAVADYVSYVPPFGIYVNRVPLKCGVSFTLRHGDQITFQVSPAFSDDEDLRFIWLQCTRHGWKPLEYRQEYPFGYD